MDGLNFYPFDANRRRIGFDHARHDEVFFLVGWRDSCPFAEQQFLRAQRILPGLDDLRRTRCLKRWGHGINDALNG